ncbi:MAG: PTS sugar transporter subunit IIB [Solobacterium sp.]|nr:PTS sugar transporter subunit IIB [Solobacterium sp.]
MAEKKIVLLCCAGMSTSMLVEKMKTVAASQKKDYYIKADTMNVADQLVPGSDVVLIGPQIRYATKKLQSQFPGIPFVDIPMQMYGLMDGKKVLELAEKNMK